MQSTGDRLLARRRRWRVLWLMPLVLVFLVLLGGWLYARWAERLVDPSGGFAHGQFARAERVDEPAESAARPAAGGPLASIAGSIPDAAGQAGPCIVTATHADDSTGLRVSGYCDAGRFELAALAPGNWQLVARRGARQSPAVTVPLRAGGSAAVELHLTETNPEPWPAAFWAASLAFPSESMRRDFRLQCSYCHAIGTPATRRARRPEQWREILPRMEGMGAQPRRDTLEALPRILSLGLTDRPPEGLAPPPAATGAALGARIVEWSLGLEGAFVHDIALGPSGWIYAVDMAYDLVYGLNTATAERRTWRVPSRGHPRGGYFRAAIRPVGTATAHQGPHSVDWARDGRLWVTNALGNEIMALDPATDRTQHWSLPRGGYYPHTHRVIGDTVWFTVALSDHLGRLDLRKNTIDLVALPRSNWEQRVAMGLLGVAFGLSSRRPGTDAHLDYAFGRMTGHGARGMPLPYGLGVAPDGTVWYGKLYDDRIGRYDPRTGERKEWRTPFSGPRRLGVDRGGVVWIAGFASGVLARFDPRRERFKVYPVPAVPTGAEMPYAVAVHPRDGHVWVAGTTMDALYEFDPAREAFAVYPLPLRGAFLREIEFGRTARPARRTRTCRASTSRIRASTWSACSRGREQTDGASSLRTQWSRPSLRSTSSSGMDFRRLSILRTAR